MHSAETLHIEFTYPECHYAECHYAECHYPECHMECHVSFIVMLNVIIPSVVKLDVVAPPIRLSPC